MFQELPAMENNMHESKPNVPDPDGQGSESDMKSLLLQEAKLKERLQAIAADVRGGLDPDSGERALQLENREVLEEIERVTMSELARVRLLIADAEKRSPNG